MTHKNGALSAAERRAAILGQHGKREEEPAVLPGPAGPVDVLVRELMGEEAQAFEEAAAVGSPVALGMLLQLALVDPDEKTLLFEVADREMLQQLGMLGLKPILLIIQRQSGTSDEDIAKAKKSLRKAPRRG